MEIKFTASIIEALQCVLRLQRGALYVLPKGKTDPATDDTKTLLDAVTNVQAPIWCNFDFFSRIKATPIQRTKRNEPTSDRRGSWGLRRTVEFFYRGRRVATAILVGEKFDGNSESLDNDSFWAVARIGYFQSFSGGESEPPENWREIEIEVTGLTGRFVE